MYSLEGLYGIIYIYQINVRYPLFNMWFWCIVSTLSFIGHREGWIGRKGVADMVGFIAQEIAAEMICQFIGRFLIGRSKPLYIPVSYQQVGNTFKTPVPEKFSTPRRLSFISAEGSMSSSRGFYLKRTFSPWKKVQGVTE